MSIGEDPQHKFKLNDNYPKWDVTFLQKYYYKWWPRKCLGLDEANLVIFILKIGKTNP
jgi:hypothetical protein